MIETEQLGIELAAVLGHAEFGALTPLVSTGFGTRYAASALGGSQLLIDCFSDAGATCGFLRMRGGQESSSRFSFHGASRLSVCPAGGWLLQPARADAPAYWLPVRPSARRLNDHGHVLEERPAEIEGVAFTEGSAAVTMTAVNGEALDLVAWRLDANTVDQLSHLAAIETQGFFLWGSHTPYRRPADLYSHLIHGSVYENRYAWPHKRRICSENDAHALYVTLSGLERATGKGLYRLLKRQLLLSVLARQSPDGGFRHGEWTDEMEAHFRLNASAMHLYLDALEEGDDPVVRRALRTGICFLAKRRDQLTPGTWFLHDELELSEVAMNRAPFRWLKSRALGKSTSNMLVLNTHIDTTIVIDRYRFGERNDEYAPLVASARAATAAVLALRPAEWLYRFVFALIKPTMLPTARARALPLPVRALKRIASKYLVPNLHRLKTRFPRLVMPGGYVDRQVPLASWAFHYLPINIMDLIRYSRRFPEDDLGTIIVDAIRFTQTSGVLDRWQELVYERYALGFWAEALYQLYMLSPEDGHYAWLADAAMRLEDLGLGLPPSLLGANCEVVARSYQVPTPSPEDARLRVINLSGAGRPVYLVVNSAHSSIRAVFGRCNSAARALAWSCGDGVHLGEQEPVVPARSWIIGRA